MISTAFVRVRVVMRVMLQYDCPCAPAGARPGQARGPHRRRHRDEKPSDPGASGHRSGPLASEWPVPRWLGPKLPKFGRTGVLLWRSRCRVGAEMRGVMKMTISVADVRSSGVRKREPTMGRSPSIGILVRVAMVSFWIRPPMMMVSPSRTWTVVLARRVLLSGSPVFGSGAERTLISGPDVHDDLPLAAGPRGHVEIDARHRWSSPGAYRTDRFRR